MGPKKKKNPHNDFYFFMQDQKKVLRRENHVWNTMEDLVAICHPRWKLLPDRDRARYKEMAKEAKKESKNDLANKFDSTGKSLLQIQNEEKSKKEFHDEMIRSIDYQIQSSHQNGTLTQEKFYFIHFNILCDLDGDGTSDVIKSIPCELAMVQWSLQQGISNFFHSFIKPPEIPMGYMYSVIKMAEDTHRITPDIEPMQESGPSSYSWICRLISGMIDGGGAGEGYDSTNYPPIYGHRNDIERINGILDDLYAWGRFPGRQKLKVYHIDELFAKLSHPLQMQSIRINSPLLAQDRLDTDSYTYTSYMSCPFHEAEDRSRFCSLMYVKRWAYSFSDYFCKAYNIEMKSETHEPPCQDVGGDYYIRMEKHFNGSWVKPENYIGAERPKGRKYIPSGGVTEKFPESSLDEIRPEIGPSSMFSHCSVQSSDVACEEDTSNHWKPIDDSALNFKHQEQDFPILGSEKSIGRGKSHRQYETSKAPWGKKSSQMQTTSLNPQSSDFPELTKARNGFQKLNINK